MKHELYVLRNAGPPDLLISGRDGNIGLLKRLFSRGIEGKSIISEDAAPSFAMLS
jgi:hypothetical protein